MPKKDNVIKTAYNNENKSMLQYPYSRQSPFMQSPLNISANVPIHSPFSRADTINPINDNSNTNRYLDDYEIDLDEFENFE